MTYRLIYNNDFHVCFHQDCKAKELTKVILQKARQKAIDYYQQNLTLCDVYEVH